MAPAIEARDVTFRRCGRSLVQRISLCAVRGELLVLCGPAGGGAETMLELMAGTLAPDAGRVLVDGVTVIPGTPRPREPRRIAHGAAEACRLSSDSPDDAVLLLSSATAGLDGDDAGEMLDACRRRARAGACVVATVDDPRLAATAADTVALVVAGRMLGWGPPAVALVPAVRHLGATVGATVAGAR